MVQAMGSSLHNLVADRFGAAMVFDPDKKEIYICLEGNFKKIWKASLENRTIETYRGFAPFRLEPIPAEGMSAADLAQW